MDINKNTDHSFNTKDINNTIQFIFNYKNNIDYSNYEHKCFIKVYEQLFISNHTNHKLYNVNKYISYIKQLDINQSIFVKL